VKGSTASLPNDVVVYESVFVRVENGFEQAWIVSIDILAQCHEAARAFLAVVDDPSKAQRLHVMTQGRFIDGKVELRPRHFASAFGQNGDDPQPNSVA